MPNQESQFTQLENELQQVKSSVSSSTDELKEIREIIKKRNNFQLIRPIDIFTKQIIVEQFTFPISTVLHGTLPATSTNYDNFFIADRSYIITSVNITYSSLGTSGTLDIRKTTSGTAVSSGISILSSIISTSGIANTNYSGTLKTDSSINLIQGDRLGLVSGGTLTGLANLVVTINLKQI